MSDLPDRDHITHDDCSTIIEAWQNGRLIDCEAIDWEAADIALRDHGNYSSFAELSRAIVDAALGIKETTK